MRKLSIHDRFGAFQIREGEDKGGVMAPVIATFTQEADAEFFVGSVAVAEFAASIDEDMKKGKFSGG
jgi:hypothetical protein